MAVWKCLNTRWDKYGTISTKICPLPLDYSIENRNNTFVEHSNGTLSRQNYKRIANW